MLRFDIALAFDLASLELDAPHAFKDNNFLVGFPLESLSGPLFPAILAKKDARLGLSPLLTGAFNVPPLYEARPLAFNPPLGFLPSLRVHAAVMFTLWSRNIYGSMHKRTLKANNVCLGPLSPMGVALFNPPTLGEVYGYFYFPCM